MRVTFWTTALVATLAGLAAARAADNQMMTRLATCQDSWLDWKDDPVAIRKLGDAFQAAFVQKEGESFFVPRATLTVAGLPVLRAFPESVGMGVGFSLMVDASFDRSRAAVEKQVGKSLTQCETSDGMRTCALEIGEKRTLMLMAEEKAKTPTTLVGCYYYYAK